MANMAPPAAEEEMGTASAFTLLPHGFKDMAECAAYNDYGTRLAIGSADGKVKVFDKVEDMDPKTDGKYELCDTWAAHNAEVFQIRWFPPTIHPALLATIGTDGKFKIWAEDPTLPPNSGRRFNSRSNKPVYEMRASSRLSFQSFDLKHNPETRATYLALLDKGGLLTVYENEEPEAILQWTQIDQFLACEKPTRGEETSMRIAFDPNLEPTWTTIREGVPRDSLAIIVAGQNTARIWRTKNVSHEVSLGAGHSKEFYRAADLPGHNGLVRDVAWAPGSIRGYDVVATACKDGVVRIFEVRTPATDGADLSNISLGPYPPSVVVPASTASNGQSGIGAGLATVRDSRQGGEKLPGQVQHVVTEVARLTGHRSQVWRCEFDADGRMLTTAADDGRVLMWRRLPSGEWDLHGELMVRRARADAADGGGNSDAA